MSKPGWIPLSDPLTNKWFLAAMDTLNVHVESLTNFDRELFQKLKDGYNLVGPEMSISRKQLNHIKGVAAELEANRYDP